jgi:hypothetical protein
MRKPGFDNTQEEHPIPTTVKDTKDKKEVENTNKAQNEEE